MQETVWFRTLSAEQNEALAASDTIPSKADVVIVGAGLIGLATAYYLLEGGAENIVILDRKGPLGEASGANAGGLWFAQQSPELGPIAGIARLSSVLYDDWAARFDCDLTRGGILQLLYDDADLERGRAAVESMAAAGFHGEVLDPAEVRRLEPELAVEASALRADRDGQVHPGKLAASLVSELRGRGVKICNGEEVRSVGDEVVTDGARISAGKVVLASGAWTPLLTATFGWNPPIKPIRGTLLALPSGPKRLRHTVMCKRYYYWQLEAGPIAGGGSEDDLGFERGVDLNTVADIRKEFDSHFPALAEQATAYAWSGFRPYCADMRPVIGPAPGAANVFVAAGHFKKGVMLAPGTGKIMADLLLTGASSDVDLSLMNPARFAA